MDKSKLHAQAVCNRRGTLRSTSIGADNHGILVVANVLLNVALQQWSSVEVIHGDIKKALILCVVKIERNHAVNLVSI